MPLVPDNEIKNENRTKLYSDLLTIIVETVELVHQQPAPHIGGTYSRFIETLQKIKAQIITFNYDLIIDQCLLNTKNWNPLFGYGIPFRSLEDPTNAKSETIFDNVRKTAPRTTMCYKLHGSINWCKPIIPPLYTESSIFLTRSSLDLPILLPVTSHSSSSTLTGDLLVEPFIVPPIMSKDDFQKEPILSNIWYRAKEAIIRSRYIFIIGYSFPPTDFFFEFLLRQARTINRFSSNEKENRVIYIVQKYSDDNVAKKYEIKVKNIFGDNSWVECRGDGTLNFLKDFTEAFKEKGL